MANKRARVLRNAVIDDKPYKANDVVQADEKVIKSYEAEGDVDSSPAAVAYAAKLPQNAKAPAEEAAAS